MAFFFFFCPQWFSLDDHKVSLASQKDVLDSKA